MCRWQGIKDKVYNVKSSCPEKSIIKSGISNKEHKYASIYQTVRLIVLME